MLLVKADRHTLQIRGLFAALVLALTLAGAAACSDDDDGGEGPTATQPGTDATASPGTTVPALPGPADALLLDWSNARPTLGGGLTAIGADGAEPAEGSAPLDVGSAQVSLASDGTKVAISAPQAGAAALRVLDTEGWTELLSADEPAGFSLFAWTPDSQRLFGFRSGFERDESGAAVAIAEVWLVDLESGATSRIAELDYQPYTLIAAPDGERLYALGREADRFDATFLAAYEVGAARERGRIELSRVLAGTGPLVSGVAERYDPGVAITADGRHLYIAHATGDEITEIDLESLTVTREVVASPRRGALDRALAALRGLLRTPASAHALSVQRREATLSPDGETLYVAGSSDDVCSLEAASCVHHRPVGLRAIDVATLQVRASVENVGAFALTADGAAILAAGWTFDEVAVREGRPGITGYGLRILDAATLEVRAHIEPEQAFAQLATGASGEFVYALTADDPPRLVQIAIASGEVASEWRMPATGAVLLEPAR